MGPPQAPGLRTCRTCQEHKAAEYFYTHPKAKDGRLRHCKSCVISKQNVHRADPKVPAALRDNRLRRQYGIDSKDYDWLHNLQGGLCAICRRPERDGSRLAVDHCHTTGNVRGLLCMPCNTDIGKLQDSPEVLQSAIRYLHLSA